MEGTSARGRTKNGDLCTRGRGWWCSGWRRRRIGRRDLVVPEEAYVRFGVAFGREAKTLAVGGRGTLSVRENGNTVGAGNEGDIAVDLVLLSVPELLCEPDAVRCVDGEQLECGGGGLSEEEGGPCEG